MKIQAVIFDMDGTIFDTERLLVRSWQEIVKRGIVPPSVLEYLPKWRGYTRDEVAKKLRDLYGTDFPTALFFQQRREIIQEILDREGVPLKVVVFAGGINRASESLPFSSRGNNLEKSWI